MTDHVDEPITRAVSHDLEAIDCLYVEDEPEMRALVSAVIERKFEEISVSSVNSVPNAMEYVETVDCIVSDFEMPERNGLEFLDLVRADHPRLPFILYTGKGSEEIASEALSRGVTDYIPKEAGTAHFEILGNRIRTAVAAHRAELALHYSEKRYRSMVEEHPNAICIVRDGTIVYANAAMAELIDADDQNSVVGIEHRKLIPPTMRERVDHRMTALIEKESPVERATGRICTLEGSQRSVEVVATPITYNETVAVQIVFTDTTNHDERERKLAAIQDRYRRIFEQSKDAIILIDPADLTVREANQSATELLGYPDDELIGLPVSAVHPDEMDRFREIVEESETGSISWTDELSCRTKKGEMLPAEISISTVAMNGERSILAMVRDVRDRVARERRLRETRLQFEAILNNPVSVVTILSTDGVVERMNQTALDIIDRDETALEGEYFWETPWWDHSPALQQELQAWIERAAGGEFVRFEANHPLPDGSDVYFDGTLYPVRDGTGDVIKLIGIGRDITELKARERELEQKNERLEQFARVVSHDLKNPVAIATGQIERAKSDGDVMHLDSAARALDRMGDLIDELLALARGTISSEAESWIHLARLADQLTESFEPGQVRIEVNNETRIHAKQGRVSQLLENLLWNSIEHGDDDVSVVIGSLPDGFYVEDDGPGISTEERDRVFEIGYTTAEDGIGLGLRIVSDICEEHGWSVEIVDGPGGGTRFEFTGVEMVENGSSAEDFRS